MRADGQTEFRDLTTTPCDVERPCLGRTATGLASSPTTRCARQKGPPNKGVMAVKSRRFVWLAARTMNPRATGVHRTCGEPSEIKKVTPTRFIISRSFQVQLAGAALPRDGRATLQHADELPPRGSVPRAGHGKGLCVWRVGCVEAVHARQRGGGQVGVSAAN